jgi:hypothetical protein
MGNRFSGERYGILNQDFFLVGERPLWVDASYSDFN